MQNEYIDGYAKKWRSIPMATTSNGRGLFRLLLFMGDLGNQIRTLLLSIETDARPNLCFSMQAGPAFRLSKEFLSSEVATTN